MIELRQLIALLHIEQEGPRTHIRDLLRDAAKNLEAQQAEISALNATLSALTRDRDDSRAELDAIHEFLASEHLEEAYQAQKKVTS